MPATPTTPGPKRKYKQRGKEPMSDENYMLNARDNLKRIKTLMESQQPKCEEWWRLRK